MKTRIVGSPGNDSEKHQYLISYLVNDVIAIDAGCIGFCSLDVQRNLQHVFISHSHADHIASLPIFLDNVYQQGSGCPTVYGNRSVIDCLHKDVFNERVWPDLLRLSKEESPFLRLEILESGKAVQVGDLTVTPVELDHVVPTLGFLVEDRASTVLFCSDTSPTEEIWDVANAKPNLKAAFVETAFPNAMNWVAEKAKHLTPATFANQIQKLDHPVQVIATHIKPSFRAEIIQELQALNLPFVEIGETEKDYFF